jgi:hypothetical protein
LRRAPSVDRGDIVVVGRRLPREIIALLQKNKLGVIAILESEAVNRHFCCRAGPTKYDEALLGGAVALRRICNDILRAIDSCPADDEVAQYLDRIAERIGEVAHHLEVGADDLARGEVA